MKIRPLVSVIMNCHNGDQYLKKSIESLINQTYKNWELIFWNNSSYDKSKKILKSFKDKRIKYFENSKLLTLYEARNLAVKKTKGKYICFLDTDDWWLKSKLKRQLEKFSSNKNLKFTYSNYFKYHEKLKLKEIRYKNKLPSGKITQNLLNHNSIGILTVMLKKEIFKNYKFNNRYNIIGDFDLFLKLSLKLKIDIIQEPLAYYRSHSSNFSKLKLSLYNSEMKEWIESNQKKFNISHYSYF